MYLILCGFIAFRKIQQLFHASSRHFPPDFLPLLKSATNFEGLVTQTTVAAVAALHLSSSLSLCLRRKRGRETERERERERRPRLRPTRKGRPWRPSSLGRGRSSIRLGSLLGTTYSTPLLLFPRSKTAVRACKPKELLLSFLSFQPHLYTGWG